MKAHLIFWPMLVQVLIPIVVLLVNAKRKAVDVKAGSVDLKKAALDNEAWSLPVVLTSKNLANQFQIPVLFYVVCLILASINAVSTTALVAALAFCRQSTCSRFRARHFELCSDSNAVVYSRYSDSFSDDCTGRRRVVRALSVLTPCKIRTLFASGSDKALRTVFLPAVSA